MKIIALLFLFLPFLSEAKDTPRYVITYKINFQEKKSYAHRRNEFAALYITQEGSMYVDRKVEARWNIITSKAIDSGTKLAQIGLPKFKAIVKKNYREAKNIIVQEHAMHQFIGHEEAAMQASNWELMEDSTILGFKVIAAKGFFFGREWKAWFCPEIPVSDGPYKFSGLPGLIFRVGSNDNHFIIEIAGIEKAGNDRTTFNLPPFEQVSSAKFKERIKYLQENPLAFVEGRVTFASLKIEGKEVSPEEFNMIARKEEEDLISLENP
jgi:GLPGLI family protein